MSELVLVLFDEDGTTAVLPPTRLDSMDRNPVKGMTCHVNYGRKKLLAEVLETSDNQDAIDEFEDNWIMSLRAKHIRELQKNGKINGYINSWPEDLVDLRSQVDKKRTSAGEVVSQQVQNEDTSKKQKIDRTIGKTLAQIRKQITYHNKENSSQKATSSRQSGPLSRNQVTLANKARPLKTQSSCIRNTRPSLKKQIGVPRTSSTTRTRIPIRKTTVLLPQKNSLNKTKKNDTLRRQSKEVSGQPTNQGAKSSEIQGTNGRKVVILHEGSGDYSGSAEPGRQPFHLNGLTDDQVDIISARLNDHRKA